LEVRTLGNGQQYLVKESGEYDSLYQAPSGPTFEEQWADQNATAIASTNESRQLDAETAGQDSYQSLATDGSDGVEDVSTDPLAGGIASVSPGQLLGADSAIGAVDSALASTVPVAPPVFSGGSPKPAVNPNAPSADSIVEMLESMTTKVGNTKEINRGSDNPTFEYNYGDGTTFTKNGNSYGITLADGTKVNASKDLGLEYGRNYGKGTSAGTSIDSLTKALQKQKIDELGEDNPGVIAFRAKQAKIYEDKLAADDRSDERSDRAQADNLVLQKSTADFAKEAGFDNVQDFYDLGIAGRLPYTVQDFKELFDPSLGPLFQHPDNLDPNNARSLGILAKSGAPTGAITSDSGPMARPDDMFRDENRGMAPPSPPGLDFGAVGMKTPYGAITSENPTGSDLIGTYDMVPGGGLVSEDTGTGAYLASISGNPGGGDRPTARPCPLYVGICNLA